MRFEKAFVPYGAYWSSPFCKWQGSFAHLNAISFAAEIGRRALAEREIPVTAFEGIALGMTVPQKHALYAGPWFAALLGAEALTGPLISQACATGARTVAAAAAEVEASGEGAVLAVTADRCSNGPHVYFPNPLGPGGTGDKEDVVLDSFGHDPWARNSMLQTAENVAAAAGIGREEQDEIALVRYRQYQEALASDRAFQRRYMTLPVEVRDLSGKKTLATVEGDEGVFPTTAEGLRALKPVLPDGTVTYGTQTHPADGNCGILIASRDRARALSRDRSVEVRIASYAEARARKGYMAMATVPAARRALEAAGIGIADARVVKTHNPFAVNDAYFAREMGLAIEAFNNYGSSLVYGHPQGPTGMRLLIETVEELALRGGGYGLFVGCAAGDSAAAVVVKVG